VAVISAMLEPLNSTNRKLVQNFLILKSYKEEMFTFLTENIFSKGVRLFSKHCALHRYDTRLCFHRTKFLAKFLCFLSVGSRDGVKMDLREKDFELRTD
jgi:hypothetical protein